MPNTKSAKKRIRQDDKKALRNRALKSRAKTAIKSVLQAVEEKDKDAAVERLATAMKTIDKATKYNVFHKNTASRKKARLSRLVNSL